MEVRKFITKIPMFLVSFLIRQCLLLANLITKVFGFFSKKEISAHDLVLWKYFESIYIWTNKRSVGKLYGYMSLGSDKTIWFRYPLFLEHFSHFSFFTNSFSVNINYSSRSQNRQPIGYLLFNNNKLSFLQNKEFELTNDVIVVNAIEFNYIGEKKYYSQLYFNMSYDFRGWYSINYLHTLKIQADLLNFPTVINISLGSNDFSILTLFETGDQSKNEDVQIQSIFDQTVARLESLLIRTENELNSNGGFKLVVPENLKTPLQQYFNYFEEYVQKTKGTKINFEVEKIDEGLQITTKTESEIMPESMTEWLVEYINLAKKSDEQMVINFSEEAVKSNDQVDLLFLGMKNEIAHLNNAVRIAEFENTYLKRENKFLKSDKAHLIKQSENLIDSLLSGIKMIPFKSGQKETKEELEALLLNGHIEKLLEILRSRFIHREDLKEIIMIELKLKEAKKNFGLGLISSEEKVRIESKATSSLLDLINKVT